MAKAHVLKFESEEERAPYIPVRDSEIYVGDRIRIRELYSTGLFEHARAGKCFREVASKKERVIIADVSRVMVGTDAVVYVVSDVVEGHDSLKASRIRHRVGSSRMKTKGGAVKEITRHPDHGPSEEERRIERPVDHSRRTRTEAFHRLHAQAVEAGVPARVIRDALLIIADDFALQIHEKANAKRLETRQEPLPEPADMGDAEVAAVKSVLAGTREPDFWMFPTLNAAIANPVAYCLANDQQGFDK